MIQLKVLKKNHRLYKKNENEEIIEIVADRNQWENNKNNKDEPKAGTLERLIRDKINKYGTKGGE